MKWAILILCYSFQAHSSTMITCGQGQFRVWSPTGGLICTNQFPSHYQDPMLCGPTAPILPFQNFPGPLFQPSGLPWWAYQGNLLYPNTHFPGPWNYPNIQAQYYPGQGEVFAAKPNVYVQSIHPDKRFKFSFTSQEPLNFLATTPLLTENNEWKGRVMNHSLFEVDGVNYDYLFYDIRLPKEKMQFEHGVCATRNGAITWMLKDLKEMNYSELALQDFEEHWRVKIPNYPVYCIYPQYNQILDPLLPVKIDLPLSTFTRVLYLLYPHKEPPVLDEVYPVPLPLKDHLPLRPPHTKVTFENMFREWGVAFLGQ